jgi:putative protease
LAREISLDDFKTIHQSVPELGLESFVHGALCISYSGQCFMSGLISERSANRGACAQSCRKDYQLVDVDSGERLDHGYLISAKDLAAYDDLASLAEAGIRCLKIEGRKKRAEYVATVTRSYRQWLDRLSRGDPVAPTAEETAPLVQIYSRGFTAGVMHGRPGRGYVTRDHADNRGAELGTVLALDRGALVVHVAREIHVGDGLAFELPGEGSASRVGGTVTAVRSTDRSQGGIRQTIVLRERVSVGATVFRNADTELLARSRAIYSSVEVSPPEATVLDVRLSGSPGTPLKGLFVAGRGPDLDGVMVQSTTMLAPAQRRTINEEICRAQFGRLGGTSYTLGAIDLSGLASGVFLPVSELNHLRQEAVAELSARVVAGARSDQAENRSRIESAVASVTPRSGRVDATPDAGAFVLATSVYSLDDAREAAHAGSTEVVVDPFLRHPIPPAARLRALAQELGERGTDVWLRLPTIVRPGERDALNKWLALGLPVVTGHLGLARELAAAGRRVTADYAVNCFNQHTAAALFGFGIERVVLSVELTAGEMAEIAAAGGSAGLGALIYGRPEGMTIEHCVLSAAFDREPTTCRDLCVDKHRNVQLTDPAGYTFAVATDSACRNRLLHSRPVEASEFLPALWRSGLRIFHLVFNQPGDQIAPLVSGYAGALASLAERRPPDLGAIRGLVGQSFTRGHFARAV